MIAIVAIGMTLVIITAGIDLSVGSLVGLSAMVGAGMVQTNVVRALEAGAAEDTLTTIETEDMPLSYLPGNSLRVRVRRVGDVAGS